MSKYDVTFAMEIAREQSAFILSEFRRWFKANNLTTHDKDNQKVAEYWELVHLQNKILDAKTVEEVKEIEAIFDNAYKSIKEVRKDAM